MVGQPEWKQYLFASNGLIGGVVYSGLADADEVLKTEVSKNARTKIIRFIFFL